MEEVFGSEVDYTILVKLYRGSQEEVRYSPANFVASKKEAISGNPDRELVSTSYVERQNLTMRMSLRRFTRLTNAHTARRSKTTFTQSHCTTCSTTLPAITKLALLPRNGRRRLEELWSIEDIVALLD